MILTELYRFVEQGVTGARTFTSGDESVDYDAGDGVETYAPERISRNEIESRNEIARANLDITVPLTNTAALRWLSDNGERIVTLTIFERAANGTVSVIWKGRLAAILPGMTSINIKVDSVYTSLRRPGLRARYQRSCRHALYRRGCGLDAADFATAGSCTAVTGVNLTVTEAALVADGYYTGGMLRTANGVYSYIVGHTGTTLTVQNLSFALIEAVAGGFPFAVEIYPGCAHDRQTCNTKFNNLPNYGGFDFIPIKNPTGGSSIV